ncbi:hypothetical protein DFH06DRAFT_1423941 [Mycena polygramma]|nr:hypothetical protein DFH06DRAFT_1423941 [Mycena polygramma]
MQPLDDSDEDVIDDLHRENIKAQKGFTNTFFSQAPPRYRKIVQNVAPILVEKEKSTPNPKPKSKSVKKTLSLTDFNEPQPKTKPKQSAAKKTRTTSSVNPLRHQVQVQDQVKLSDPSHYVSFSPTWDALAARCFHLVWLASALQPVADCFAFASPLTAQSSDPHAPLVILLTLATILPWYPSSQVASGAALVSSLVFGILALVELS